MKSFRSFITEARRDPATAKDKTVAALNKFLKGFDQYQHGKDIGWIDKSESKMQIDDLRDKLFSLGFKMTKNASTGNEEYWIFEPKKSRPYVNTTATVRSKDSRHVWVVSYKSSAVRD